MIEAGPGAPRDAARGMLCLRPESARELRDRLTALLAEFAARDEPDGERLSYLWSLIARTPAADESWSPVGVVAPTGDQDR